MWFIYASWHCHLNIQKTSKILVSKLNSSLPATIYALYPHNRLFVYKCWLSTQMYRPAWAILDHLPPYLPPPHPNTYHIPLFQVYQKNPIKTFFTVYSYIRNLTSSHNFQLHALAQARIIFIWIFSIYTKFTPSHLFLKKVIDIKCKSEYVCGYSTSSDSFSPHSE